MPTAAAFRRSCLFLAPVALALLVAGASALPAGSAPSGLVAAYGFDEVGGSTVTDASGNGNTGTISGAVRSASGRYGGALSFDGDNDLVTVPDANSLDLSNGMTLEAWVRPEALGTSWRTAIVKEQTNTLAYALYAHTNYSGPSGHVYTGGADRRARAGALLPLDAWSHVAATFDGTTIRVYRDGTEIAAEPVTGAITTSSGPLQIGGTQLWSEWFEGLIDEVRVYNRALSVAEIKSDMETRVGSVADTTAPSSPTDLERTAATLTTISISWRAASDNVGVTEYGLYRNGTRVGVTGSTTGTVGDLACGTTYTLGVDAADAAGNRSTARTISASTAACAGPPNPAPTQRGLVAAYSFDETTGGTVADVSGNGNVGTLAGPSRSAAGRYGGALAFDGADDLVTVADAASLDLTSGMTLEAWVRPSSLGSRWRTILVKEQTDDLAFALYAHTGGRGPSSHVFVSGDDRRARAGTAIPAEGWTHVAATYDGATIRVYRNGSVTASQAATGNITTSDRPLRIGGNTVWNEWFHGLIDELRIYDRPLSAAEIAADMQAPLGGSAPAADTTAPVGPGGVTRTGATETSVSLSWTAATDDVGVTEYGLYRNGTRSGTSHSTTGTVTGLTCNTTYTLGVDAADAAGNRSAIRTITASTAACVAADTTPPSTPTGLAVTGATSSSVSLAWNASTDDVGVAGYRVANGSNWVGTTTTRTYTVPDLACGSTYSLGVDAFDEAGNRSGKASVSASTSVCSAPPPSPAPGGSASVYVSSGGSDSAGCSVSAPCRSFDRAYRVAQPGEVVEVAAGSYGSQSIGKDAAKTSAADVLFRPAAGATVTLSSLSISGSHLEVRDMRLTTDGSVGSSPIDTRDVTLRNLTGRSLFLRADDVLIAGGSYGGFNGCDAGAPEDGVKIWSDSNRGADRITLDGVRIHDIRRTGCDRHTDCIQIYSGTNHTIKNSTLVNCPTTGIIARPSSSSQKLENITIENNYFGAVLDGSEAINIGTAPDRCSGMVIRYNTVVNESSSFDCLTASGSPGSLVEGNIISVGAGNDATFRNNVFRTGSAVVGTGAVQCNPAYRNSTAGDWRLAATDTCARGRGNPNSHPTTDAEGQTRPQGTIDAGADEIS